MYEYRCKILKVVDGDTIDAQVDLGFRVTIEMRFRLTGINAPERNTPQGPAATARLIELCPVGSMRIVRTNKDKQEKFGRYLGRFFDEQGNDINSQLIAEGVVVPYMEKG